jgi:hypothetical protein
MTTMSRRRARSLATSAGLTDATLVAGAPSRGTVLVSGALGYTGRHLVRRLLDAGFAVRAVDTRLPRASTGAACGAERVQG